jgi:hypothetical protein
MKNLLAYRSNKKTKEKQWKQKQFNLN